MRAQIMLILTRQFPPNILVVDYQHVTNTCFRKHLAILLLNANSGLNKKTLEKF